MPRKPGPGRKRLGGSRVAVRLSEAQHAALSAAAREARVDLSTFVREMALRGAGMAQLSEHAWLAEGRRMIETTIGNGLRTDARVHLVIAPARDCGYIGGDTPMVAAIDTNGGAVFIDVTGSASRGIPIADACAELECTPAELRAAVVAAYSDAADWDWSGETAS